MLNEPMLANPDASDINPFDNNVPTAQLVFQDVRNSTRNQDRNDYNDGSTDSIKNMLRQVNQMELLDGDGADGGKGFLMQGVMIDSMDDALNNQMQQKNYASMGELDEFGNRLMLTQKVKSTENDFAFMDIKGNAISGKNTHKSFILSKRKASEQVNNRLNMKNMLHPRQFSEGQDTKLF